jgi:ubiquinol-cytochrome c reductase iron-sulfur subunit
MPGADASSPDRGPSRPSGREDAFAKAIAVLFVLAILAGLGLLVLYALGGQTQLEGILLGILLGGIGGGLVLWGKELFPPQRVIEDRGPHGSGEENVEAVDRSLDKAEQIPRRTMLVRLLLGTFGALGLAAIFPIRSLGPSPGGSLFRTSWRRGLRLVTETGEPVRVDTLPVGGVVTVFPEGYTTAEDSQAILVRVESGELRLPTGREGWAPQGNVCYSKICTHAGCPVGLYSKDLQQLQCPCHQSAFDVLNGAEPVFGPAPRPLPQLDVYADDQGFLRARSDFDEPVGPGFWNAGRGGSG